MVQRGVHRLIVLDAEQAVVGIVTSMDIVKAVAAGKKFAVDADDEYPAEDRHEKPTLAP